LRQLFENPFIGFEFFPFIRILDVVKGFVALAERLPAIG